MTSVGWATLDVIPSVKGIAKELDKQTGGPLAAAGKRGGEQFGENAGRSAGSRFGSVFSKAAKASMLGLAGAGALAFKVGKDSIAQASELGESLNAVTVSYGEQAKGVKRLGEQAAESLGLSNAEFNGLAVRFSAFATTISGGESKKVVGTLDDLTTRASDFASVMNLDVADAAALFQSGLAGETEPLRQYGIDLSAAAVEAHALATGIADGRGEMSEAEKVQARYSLLMEQTAKTQGDFANTSDSLANQQRILNARWDDARAKLGNALLPAVENVTSYLVDEGIPAFERFSDWFAKDGLPAIQEFGDWAGENLVPVVKDVGKFLGGAAKRGGDLIEVLNDLPDPAKYAGLVAALTGGAALKLRGGGNNPLGNLGSALGLAKVIRTFETNPAALGSGGGVTPVGVTPGGKPAPPLTKGAKISAVMSKAAVGSLAGLIGIPVVDAVVKSFGTQDKILDPIGDSADRTREWLFNNAPREPVTTSRSILGDFDPQKLNETREAQEKLNEKISVGRAHMASFVDSLDLAGNKKVNPGLAVPTLPEWRERLARFYELEIQAGRPIEPNLRVLGFEPAMDKLYKLQQLQIGDKTINIHTKYVDPGEPDFLSGGVSGQRANGGHVNARESYLVGERGPEIFRPAGAGSIVANHELVGAGAGVQVNIGQVVAHDYHDFMRQTQRRTQRAGLGGFGR